MVITYINLFLLKGLIDVSHEDWTFSQKLVNYVLLTGFSIVHFLLVWLWLSFIKQSSWKSMVSYDCSNDWDQVFQKQKQLSISLVNIIQNFQDSRKSWQECCIPWFWLIISVRILLKFISCYFLNLKYSLLADVMNKEKKKNIAIKCKFIYQNIWISNQFLDLMEGLICKFFFVTLFSIGRSIYRTVILQRFFVVKLFQANCCQHCHCQPLNRCKPDLFSDHSHLSWFTKGQKQ